MVAKENPVDAVITWVDGNERAYAEKLHRHFSDLNMERPKEASDSRYNQCGEINYCVASLLRFTPWIRNIFIVTDSQIPPIVHQLRNTAYASKIKLIDHAEIFHGLEHGRPSFNSLSIESVLWRIPGLAERFIYLNDDSFIIQPVSYEHFFRNKNLVLRGSWKTIIEYKWLNRIKHYANNWWSGVHNSYFLQKENAHRFLQEKTAKMAGFQKKFFHLPHVPVALKRSTLENFFREHPNLLSENVAYNFRNAKQFWTISLAQHIEIKNKEAIFDNSLKAAYVDADMHSIDKMHQRLQKADKNKNIAFVCMQSMNALDDSTKSFMLNWLDNRISLEAFL